MSDLMAHRATGQTERITAMPTTTTPTLPALRTRLLFAQRQVTWFLMTQGAVPASVTLTARLANDAYQAAKARR